MNELPILIGDIFMHNDTEERRDAITEKLRALMLEYQVNKLDLAWQVFPNLTISLIGHGDG